MREGRDGGGSLAFSVAMVVDCTVEGVVVGSASGDCASGGGVRGVTRSDRTGEESREEDGDGDRGVGEGEWLSSEENAVSSNSSASGGRGTG